MGRRSVRKNKTIFLQIREEKGLSREAACERLGSVSYSRLVRIEAGETPAYPEEVMLMAGLTMLISTIRLMLSASP